jgi:hypothetical protein
VDKKRAWTRLFGILKKKKMTSEKRHEKLKPSKEEGERRKVGRQILIIRSSPCWNVSDHRMVSIACNQAGRKAHRLSKEDILPIWVSSVASLHLLTITGPEIEFR